MVDKDAWTISIHDGAELKPAWRDDQVHHIPQINISSRKARQPVRAPTPVETLLGH
jgi:hypothetical protein